MTGSVIKAEGFIWLIVGIFWVIAQIAGAAAKKKQQYSPLSADGDGPARSVDPLTELLRKMTGEDLFRAEPPDEEYAAEPETNPWSPGEIEALPDIEPLRRETTGQSDVRQAPIEAPEVDIRPQMSAFRNSIPSIRLPTISLSFQGSETSVCKVSNIGNLLNPADKNLLRRAMLSHIIFSPPKALEK